MTATRSWCSRASQQRLTIRLACIDAPEMAQAPDGANARHCLQRRLRLGSRVILRPQTVDRYGRTVAEGIREINLGLAMGKDGMAFAYRKNLVLSNLKTSHSRTFHALNLETYGKRCLGALYFRYIHRSKL